MAKKAHFAKKIQRAWRKRRRYRRYRKPASARTGSLTVRQKEFSTITLGDPTQPFPQAIPTGMYHKITFDIENIPNIMEYQRLFDQYRICAVSFTLTPTTNTDDATQPGFTFASSIDLDGGGLIPQTIPQMLARANVKTSPFASNGGMTPYKKIYLKPRWANLLVNDVSGGTVATARGFGSRKMWLDMAYPGIEHHGLDLMWFNSLNRINAPMYVDVITTYYLQFRKVR